MFDYGDRIKRLFRGLRHDTNGATAIETALVIVLIAAGLTGVLMEFADSVSRTIQSSSSALAEINASLDGSGPSSDGCRGRSNRAGRRH